MLITACTLAGANFGFALLWALLFATLATIILQEMSARLGAVTGKGLGETLAELLAQSPFKWPLFLLIGVALYAGNAAYQAGNLTGSALGVIAATGYFNYGYEVSVTLTATIAALLLVAGSYKAVERVLISLVGVMALCFAATFFIVRPDLGALVSGLLVPRIPDGATLTVLALIGTTVVPYNLFLHASAVAKRFKGPEDLPAARTDTFLSIGIGGVVAMLIVSTAAASMFSAGVEIKNVNAMAGQFEPLFGPASKYRLGIGYFAAGLTSSMTAPLATSYAVTEILQISEEKRETVARLVMLSVILVGLGLSLTGVQPVSLIISAQFANGLLLPIVAIFLIAVLNQKKILGPHANGPLANAAGAVVVLVTLGLGIRLIARSLDLM